MRQGWWHTTDPGRREADGTIHFLGTMTGMIKSAAENIYPPRSSLASRAIPPSKRPPLSAFPIRGTPSR